MNPRHSPLKRRHLSLLLFTLLGEILGLAAARSKVYHVHVRAQIRQLDRGVPRPRTLHVHHKSNAHVSTPRGWVPAAMAFRTNPVGPDGLPGVAPAFDAIEVAAQRHSGDSSH